MTAVVHPPLMHRLAAWARAAVVACAALAAGPALAQPTAEEIAERAIAAIGAASQATVDRIGAGAQRGVAGVEYLDRQGARDARIISFGQSAIEALQRMGQAGRSRINTIAANAVQALSRMNAPQALIDSVLEAARAGRQPISQAQQRGVQAVRDAVAEAIGPP